MNKKCILCGKQLSEGKTNREHFIPNTCIRNFKKLRIPDNFNYALRIDIDSDGGEILLAPRSSHKRWAVVVVHEKCNSDASHMCQDIKKIIDNPHKYPKRLEKSIIEYYAHIWHEDVEDMYFENLQDKEVDELFKDTDHTCGLERYLWPGMKKRKPYLKSNTQCFLELRKLWRK